MPTGDCEVAGTFDAVTQQCSAPTAKADGTTCGSETTDKCGATLLTHIYDRLPQANVMRYINIKSHVLQDSHFKRLGRSFDAFFHKEGFILTPSIQYLSRTHQVQRHCGSNLSS